MDSREEVATEPVFDMTDFLDVKKSRLGELDDSHESKCTNKNCWGTISLRQYNLYDCDNVYCNASYYWAESKASFIVLRPGDEIPEEAIAMNKLTKNDTCFEYRKSFKKKRG